MTALLQSLTFTTPWALSALVLLPLIWWLLRFSPPRPQVVTFAPLRLLLDLVSRQQQPDRTPWWLLLLRMLIAALIIAGVSHPLWAPGHVAVSAKPLLLVIDDSWAAAADWPRRQAVMAEVIAGARGADATVTLATTVPETRPADIVAASAADAGTRAAALLPKALAPDRLALLARLTTALGEAPALRVVWLSDGIDDGTAGQFAEGLAKLAGGAADIEAIVPSSTSLPLAFKAPALDGAKIKLTALRAPSAEALTARAIARAGNGRSLGEVALTFAAGSRKTEAFFDLPVELRNEMQQIVIDGERTAGSVYLLDDRWRRKSVALLSSSSGEESQPLLAPLYYVSRALEPFAELSEPADRAALAQTFDGGLSMLVLADVGVLPTDTEAAVAAWVEKGGVLLRFAGPRLAAAEGATLLPVTLRAGDRALDSALSWETPQAMQDFAETSPFAGLVRDEAVKITRQVLADPDAELPAKVWASLADGTPLVTANRQGKGLVVLFHVTANADWSNLPLTGLFVDMLRRVLDLAPAAGSTATAAKVGVTSAAQSFSPFKALSGDGLLIDPAPETRPLAQAAFDKASATTATPPGLYRRGEQERAINLAAPGDALLPIAGLPAGVTVSDLAPAPARALAPIIFGLAFLLFLADALAALVMGGGLSRLRHRCSAAALLAALVIIAMPDHQARADAALDFALRNATQTHLAYVVTGDATVDQISEQGLRGLSQVLADRTSLEPSDPTAVNIESDELAFFPILYWPVLETATVPSDQALARIKSFMKNGGLIFFDLREDGAGAGALMGGTSPSAEALRRILAKVDIPPLELLPADHVLTRSFYLLEQFPGRYEQGGLWVERGGSTSAASNTDGVSSIIIGANDYAAAWAFDQNGQPLYAVIPGSDRQREMAFRAGVNIVMYALTGNYKADQVHVPDILDRLGQ